MKYYVKFFVSISVILFLLFNSVISQNTDSLNYQRVPLSFLSNSLPQSIDPLETKIDYTTLGIIGGVTLGIGTAVHLYQADAWWQDQNSTFKIQNDATYALSLDKFGHFYATALMAHGLSAGLEAANLDLEQSAVYGAIGAFAFETFIEIEDGYGPNWGFSPGDWTADFLGAAYTVGQYYFPVLKHIQPRASYYPSKDYRTGVHKGTVSDDYKGQKYWIGFRMKELLPETISEYWPSFLMLSVGMGLSNWDGYGGGNQDFYIALDFDAETIPLYGPTWQFIKNTLNFLHFPMPGIRITPNSAAFVFVY